MTIRHSSSSTRLAAGSALGLVLAAVSQPAFAQDNDGEYWLARKTQIVVTATRIATPAEDVPATVTVKSDEQIADEMVTDIRDLVRFEPGVSVQRQGFQPFDHTVALHLAPHASALFGFSKR